MAGMREEGCRWQGRRKAQSSERPTREKRKKKREI